MEALDVFDNVTSQFDIEEPLEAVSLTPQGREVHKLPVSKKRRRRRKRNKLKKTGKKCTVSQNVLATRRQLVSRLREQYGIELLRRTPKRLLNHLRDIAKEMDSGTVIEYMDYNCSLIAVCDLGALVDQLILWKEALPCVSPYYAVKCNPDPNIIRSLKILGTGFDCASKAEIEYILQTGASPDRIIFANPAKLSVDVLFAKKVGVKKFTLDSLAELRKMHALYPEAELVLRILSNDSFSVMPFGFKFGCSYEDSLKVFEEAKKLKVKLMGISFHVGSGCFSAKGFTTTLQMAERLFSVARNDYGLNFTFLDIGGGFPGHFGSEEAFASIAQSILPSLKPFVDNHVKIIGEPGRFFSCKSTTILSRVHASRVVLHSQNNMYDDDDPLLNTSSTTTSPGSSPASSPVSSPAASPATSRASSASITPTSSTTSSPTFQKKIPTSTPKISDSDTDIGTDNVNDDNSIDDEIDIEVENEVDRKLPVREIQYYLSDGVYGSFNNIIYDHANPEGFLLYEEKRTGPKCRSTLFGPTCDSCDVIAKDVILPELELGDWLYFPNMGMASSPC